MGYLSEQSLLAKCVTWNITLRMRKSREVSDFASQKFRLTPVPNGPRSGLGHHWFGAYIKMELRT